MAIAHLIVLALPRGGLMLHRYSLLALLFACALAQHAAAQDSWPTRSWPVSTPAAVGLDPYYRRGDLHTMQSVTKTVTSILIGVATSRKEFPDLDTPILKFFDTSKVANIDDRKRRITIRHVLTMTAELDWRQHLPHNYPNN